MRSETNLWLKATYRLELIPTRTMTMNLRQMTRMMITLAQLRQKVMQATRLALFIRHMKYHQ